MVYAPPKLAMSMERPCHCTADDDSGRVCQVQMTSEMLLGGLPLGGLPGQYCTCAPHTPLSHLRVAGPNHSHREHGAAAHGQVAGSDDRWPGDAEGVHLKEGGI